jgi:glutamyl-tRNA synthetase
LQDLELLNIRGDKISHTSDYFDQIYDLAIQIIKSGKAYTDDTEQAQVRIVSSYIMHECRWIG